MTGRAAVAICALWIASSAGAESFDDWLEAFRTEAAEAGVSERSLAALDGLEPDVAVVDLDRNQPSVRTEFCDYMDRRITQQKIERAQAEYRKHGALLAQIEAKYGVPPRYLVALWGLESHFGGHQGSFSVIRSLATLAHDARRSDVFRRQLLAALRMLDGGALEPDDMKGSWAGAMGQVQFMPTTYLAYAVDWDGDGRKDIWKSVPDALASAANYLSKAGWNRHETWGRRVTLPSGLDLAGDDVRRTISEWSQRGVRRSDGSALPTARLSGRVVLPTPKRDPAFLVYPNYDTILRWNRSTYFGMSVGTLADRITKRGDRVCSV